MPKMRFLLRECFQKAQWWHQLHLPVKSSVGAEKFQSRVCRECSRGLSFSCFIPRKRGDSAPSFHLEYLPQWQHQLPLQLTGFLAVQVLEELRYLNHDFLTPLNGAVLLTITKLFSKDAFALLGTNLPWICLPLHFWSLSFICSCLQPSEAHRTKCLSLALADILWRAGGHEKALVALWVGEALLVTVHCSCTSICPKSA